MSIARRLGALGVCAAILVPAAGAQELPLSGVTGFDLFYATSPSGTSRLLAVNIHRALVPFEVGPTVDAVPSRWAHRRRTLGALETSMALGERGVYLTPMGNAVGNGAIHLVDVRQGVQTALVSTGNPAGYDLAVLRALLMVFSAEDDGAGNTVLRGFSYATPGQLAPLSPASLTLPGSPAAYVNRIGVDKDALELHVPTATGIHVIQLSSSAPNMAVLHSLPTGAAAPATNPVRFVRNGQPTWVVGTSTFNTPGAPDPLAAGYFSWDTTGAFDEGEFGPVPGVPGKKWVPAAGTEELAVVADAADAYVYYLLREPPPGTFFIKPSAIGVVRFLAGAAPVVSTIAMPDTVGEPFANPAVHGTRVAFESSFGPPFIAEPPDGGEKISILYTPLDPLGVGTPDGVLGVPDPLGGRVSTKGMDRPIWTRDGKRVLAATSHFPGAPNPGIPGLEVLDVPADVPLSEFMAPHTVVANEPFPNQSILFPSAFQPRIPAQAVELGSLSFFGNVFHQGLSSLTAASFGEVGQIQVDPAGFVQSPAVPNFRAILPASFNDATASTIPIPANFGMRRTTFNFAPYEGFSGVTMSAAIEDEVLVQLTGHNVLASFGLMPAMDPVRVALPSGWITTTEFLSL
jgi:hypothetical protein